MTFAKYPVTGGGGGTGDVVGPASSVNNGLALFDGATGKLIKDAGVGSANQVLVTNGTTPAWSGTPSVTGMTLSDFSTGFKFNNGTANVLTIEANVPTGAQTLTIPVIAAGSTFILNRGAQLFEDTMFFKQGASVITSLYMSATLGGNEYTITPVAPAANRAYSLPDAGGAAAFVMSAGNSTIGGTKTFSSGVVINPTTNQLVLGVTNTTTINSAAPAASRTYNIIDAGGAADFVMTAAVQTIGGAKTFSSAVTINPASNQLVLASGVNQLTLNSSTSAAARTYSFPDVGTTGSIAMLEGAQTFSGLKTFSAGVAITGGTAATQRLTVSGTTWTVGNGPTITEAGAATFATSVTSPLIVGGSSVSQVLTIKSTTGIGTSDRIDFTVGNNGAVTGLSIGTAGQVTAGPNASTNLNCIVNGRASVTHGLTFPAVQNSSADVNTLDDYEEGTFTPIMTGTTLNGAGTYSSQTGRYTKIGDLVFFALYVEWSAHTGTGNMRIGQLPFTSKNATGDYVITSIIHNNLTHPANSIVIASVPQNASYMDLATFVPGSSARTALAVDAACGFYITGSYLAAT
jgi:hypothetical protein